MSRFIVFFSVAIFFSLNAYGEQYRYEPTKFVEQSAKLSCQSLARISLGRQENLSITAHTKATVIGTAHNDRKVIAVSYPYRTDGVSFACVFYDFTDGQLQLIEFGHVGKNSNATTTVKLLY